MGNGLAVKPIIAPLRIRLDEGGEKVLLLDSWIAHRTIQAPAGRDGQLSLEFLVGQQTSFGIWSALCAEMKKQLQSLTDDQLPHLFAPARPVVRALRL